ncbi:S9 family peptidase [Lysobacter sp. TY2-98]|uniref:S9 family peptidase n=1 Tax=Lysobacter sp. TY2-98 TaxID=2290922 RepID=UPI0013B404D8|nr:S9 family peptidase [Lysobacter sp. TY2-98]
MDTCPDAGRGARRLTSPDFNARAMLVAADGERAAFISERDPEKGPQVQLIRFDGGEARPVTDTHDPISSLLAWSPDGTRVLALQTVQWKEDERDDPEAKQRPLVVRYLPYKMDGSGPKVGARTRLVSIDVASGEITPLVDGDFDVSDAAWSPDGTRLAFSRKRDGLQRHPSDLWLADANGQHAHRITTDLYSVTGIRFSPDGRRIAFAAGRIEGDSIVQLYVHDIASGRCECPKGDDLQLEGATLLWHSDGERIATVASHGGLFEIAVLHVASGEVRYVARGLRHVTALAASGDALVFVAASVRRLDEVYRVDWDGANERRLTAFNRTWFSARVRPRVKRRRFQVPNAKGGTETIDAWLLLPPKGDGPFPALVDFHGGPQSIALLDFASHVYWYPLIAHGYAVIAPNPVGSGGYGGEFARRLIGHWGEYDLPQVEAVLDHLQKDEVITKSIGCYGKSYGGYLSAWSAARSDMFKAAVVSAPVANLKSHGGTSDTGYYVTPYAMGADLYESDDRYRRLSPVEYAASVDTATLFLNGRDDQRCPAGQCEEMFANMIRAGHRNCMMVLYPAGTHSLSGSGNPSHRVDYHDRVVNWIRANV